MMDQDRIAPDAFYPCGPPATYEVSVRPSGDFVTVRATLLEPWPAAGRGTVLLMADWHDEPGSYRYFGEPCWLFRFFGDTLDWRIERAKRSVSAWAEREIRKRQRVWLASHVTLAAGPGREEG
jgi:hypothetical protein